MGQVILFEIGEQEGEPLLMVLLALPLQAFGLYGHRTHTASSAHTKQPGQNSLFVFCG